MLLLLALFACTFARADLAAVKAALDTPVEMTIAIKARSASDDERREDRARLREIFSGKAPRTISPSPRKVFEVLAETRNRTTIDLAVLNAFAVANAAKLEELIPVLEAANQQGAVADLKEALATVKRTKLLDRAAQDRFARLARVAP